jgi:hypothetical protein
MENGIGDITGEISAGAKLSLIIARIRLPLKYLPILLPLMLEFT